jgi:hypothetical protein
MFTIGAEDDGFNFEKKQREIWCEEIQGLMLTKWPGQTATEKAAKSEILEKVFGTRSWTKVESLHSDKIKSGFLDMKSIIEDQPAEPQQ